MSPDTDARRESRSRPARTVQRDDVPRCPNCGSSDLWKVGKRSGFVAMIMKYRGRRPIQCRGCRSIHYVPREE